MYIWDLLMHLPLQLGHLHSWCFDINDLSSVLWHWSNQFFTKELLKGCPGQWPLNLPLLKHNIRGYKLISWGLSCRALSNNTRLLSLFQTLSLVQLLFCLASRFVYWVSGIFLFLVVLGRHHKDWRTALMCSAFINNILLPQVFLAKRRTNILLGIDLDLSQISHLWILSR